MQTLDGRRIVVTGGATGIGLATGRPEALLWFGRQYQLLTVDLRGDRIREVHSIMNPDKLRYLCEQPASELTG